MVNLLNQYYQVYELYPCIIAINGIDKLILRAMTAVLILKRYLRAMTAVLILKIYIFIYGIKIL